MYMLTTECMYVCIYGGEVYATNAIKNSLLDSVADQYNNIVNNYMRK